MATKQEKTVDDIQWVTIPTPDRGTQQACSIGDAEIYMRPLSKSGLLLVLDKYQITRYAAGHGRIKYVLRIDLDHIKRLRSEVRIADEPGTSSVEQLIEQAAQLLEQVQAGQIDTAAITAWLELYQSKE